MTAPLTQHRRTVEESNLRQVGRYLGHLKVRCRSDVTIKDYGYRLNNFVKWLDTTPILLATTEDLEEYLARPLRNGGQRQASTISKDVTAIRELYKYLSARSELPYGNPAAPIDPPRVRNQNPRPVSHDVWTQVWTSTALLPSDRVLLGLGAFLGLRRAEISGLRTSQVDPSSGRLDGFRRKGGGDDVLPYKDMVRTFSERHPVVLPESEAFLEPLHALAATGEDVPLLGYTSPKKVNVRLDEALNRAGLPPERRFTPHQLRHSCCTWLIQAGVPIHIVSALLNHTSLDMTLRYLKLATSDLDTWLNGGQTTRRSTRRRPE